MEKVIQIQEGRLDLATYKEHKDGHLQLIQFFLGQWVNFNLLILQGQVPQECLRLTTKGANGVLIQSNGRR